MARKHISASIQAVSPGNGQPGHPDHRKLSPSKSTISVGNNATRNSSFAVARQKVAKRAGYTEPHEMTSPGSTSNVSTTPREPSHGINPVITQPTALTTWQSFSGPLHINVKYGTFRNNRTDNVSLTLPRQ